MATYHHDGIQACEECADACDNCAASCLLEHDVTPMARCIALDIDCAQACRLAASLMARGSDFAGDACGLCAAICRACAAECGRHPHEHCRKCAQACRACAEVCEAMVAGARAGGGAAAAAPEARAR